MTSPRAAACRPAGRALVASDLLGEMEISDDHVLLFEDGIPGFADCTRWILVDGERPGTAWLQSLDVSMLVFLLIDPFVYFDGFSVDLAPHDVRCLGAHDATQLAVFAIVTFPANRAERATANLQGPIVINVEKRRAAQVVLSDGSWGVREPVQLFPMITTD